MYKEKLLLFEVEIFLGELGQGEKELDRKDMEPFELNNLLLPCSLHVKKEVVAFHLALKERKLKGILDLERLVK